MQNFYQDVIQLDSRFHSTARIADPLLLEPVLRGLVQQILQDAAAHGVQLMVFETFRSKERQTALFNQGATRLREVGVHHYGLACDLVKVVAGEPTWKGDYSLLGELARQYRLIWGGDWGQPDAPRTFIDAVHVQRCALWRQAELFGNQWYPPDDYDALKPRLPQLTVSEARPLGQPTAAIRVISSTERVAMPQTPTEAGQGEHHVYRVPSGSAGDQEPLTANRDYLGIDALAWYVNKQSSWFRDRTASGVLTATLASGSEQYQAALGTFELDNGQKTAPVFGKPVLPDRNFVGGPVTVSVTLTSMRRNTVIGNLINSAASASLGIIAGMVQTATVTGPTQILAAAGSQLIAGVKKTLDDPEVKTEPLFDANGLQITLQPSEIIGPEGYLLLHRGASLDESKLSIGRIGQLLVPFLGARPLDDGAWLLLRLRRTRLYSGFREWFTLARKLRSDITALVSDVDQGVRTKDDALKLLLPSAGANPTIWDAFVSLRGVIASDGVLSEAEAQSNAGQLAAVIAAARDTIAKHGTGHALPEHFDTLLSGLEEALSAGHEPPPALGSAFLQEAERLAQSRASARQLVAGSASHDIFATMKLLSTIPRL
ncbi:MAG TPA: M15 family metallopeptidase [Steroidobacteraceae bacterium]